MHSIFIGVGATGEFPWHLREGKALPQGNVRWRLVAETDDDAQAVRIMKLVARRIRGERRLSIDWDALERQATGPTT